MNIVNLVVVKGLVAQKSPKTPQLIRVSASTTDIKSGVVDLAWHNVHSDGTVDDAFATANIYYGDAADWLSSWVPISHLIQGRIQALELLTKEGTATRFSHNMAYNLFANNLVDYANKYRGMSSVVIHGLEAFADVVLTSEKGGTWTVPPYFIDSVAHLAGFIMNVSDAIDTRANFCVTPGWRSMRFARPLVAGGKYRSYTKMIPSPEDPTTYFGDVYVLQDDTIIGMTGGIQFRRYPRILLNRFFSAPDADASTSHAAIAPAAASSLKPALSLLEQAPKATVVAKVVPATQPTAANDTSAPTASPVALLEISKAVSQPSPSPDVTIAVDADSTAAKAIALIANEAGLELADLHDEATFANLGIDSLMSLVISEKFREELGITVGGSLFLEYPTMGDLRSWLEEYYS